jgi:AAHS family 4-hydroxybenzoate transporter-like MFS transporter
MTSPALSAERTGNRLGFQQEECHSSFLKATGSVGLNSAISRKLSLMAQEPVATAPSTVDVSEIIDDASIGALHVGIFTLCALCMVMDGFDVYALGYAAPAIVREWKVSPALLGPVFGAVNVGVLVGQVSFTMLADRIGRRPVLIGGVLFFGVMTFFTARVTSISELLILRLIAGMGLGSIIPNATALVGEFSPRTHRVALITWIGIGFTLGGVISGFIAAWMIPRFGWRSVFYFGGVLPLVLAVLMLVWLPESLRLLVLRGKRPAYVARWLARVNPAVAIARDPVFVVREHSKAGIPVVHLFRDGRAAATMLLWAVNFMNLLSLYSLANWLPTVVRGAGYSTAVAVLVGTTLQVGGALSPFLLAWLVVRRGFVPVLTATFGIATVAVALIGQPGLSLALLVSIVFVAGACVVGGQPSVNALSATFYPTYLRSTGLGWSLGVGRVGSIVGPVTAGWFIGQQWSTHAIFLALAVPASLSMLFVFLLRWTNIETASRHF